MDPWILQAAAEIGRRAPRELEALVAVSSPSGDVHGANECASVCAALLPDEAAVERVPCSSPDHAEDLVARLHGTGTRRVLLVGHIDTVVAHAQHKPLTRVGEQLVGSGTVDMKGGVILSIGALRAFAKRPELYAEIALLLVCDEEWRTADFSPRRALRGLRRLPVLRGRRDERAPTRASSSGARRRGRSGSSATAAARTPARRRTAGATRCSRSPPPPRPSPPTTIRAGRRG